MTKKTLQKYNVVVKNDSKNAIEKVVYLLVTKCNLEPEVAEAKTYEIHHTGKSIVGVAHFELAETIAAELVAAGLVADIEERGICG